MVAHLLLKMQLSQCSSISHLLNLSTQSKDMQSRWLNSQRVLGRACWSRIGFWRLKKCQGTSSPRKRGLRGINTPHFKTSHCNCQVDRSDRSPRPVRPIGSNKLAVGPRSVRPVRAREVQTPVYKTPLDHSSISMLVLRCFLSGSSHGSSMSTFDRQIINIASLLIVRHTYTQD